jgi:hypothetical protein
MMPVRNLVSISIFEKDFFATGTCGQPQPKAVKKSVRGCG